MRMSRQQVASTATGSLPATSTPAVFGFPEWGRCLPCRRFHPPARTAAGTRRADRRWIRRCRPSAARSSASRTPRPEPRRKDSSWRASPPPSDEFSFWAARPADRRPARYSAGTAFPGAKAAGCGMDLADIVEVQIGKQIFKVRNGLEITGGFGHIKRARGDGRALPRCGRWPRPWRGMLRTPRAPAGDGC